MSESRYSLNPNANSFVPSKKSEVMKEMAMKSVAELFEKKKAHGETTVTNQEIAKLVGHLISVGYKQLTSLDKLKITKFLSFKILNSQSSVDRHVPDLLGVKTKLGTKQPKSTSNKEQFDVSKFCTPTTVYFLLVAFWGLYRHEQAQRPLLSLTYRPDTVKNKIWSIDASDKNLWNQSCVTQVCDCPPMFGYSVPSNFFGSLSYLQYICPVQKIHLNHYPESTNGNEFILTENFQRIPINEHPFEEVVVSINIKTDLNVLKDQFETIISGICNTLLQFAESAESELKENETEDIIDYYSSLWDEGQSNVSHNQFFQPSIDNLVDNNDHPLLEVSDDRIDEEVSPEVKEMIRKIYFPKEDKVIENEINDTKDDGELVCDPPCSVWCDSNNKENKIEHDNHSKPIPSKEKFEDAQSIDLISFDELDSKEKLEPVSIILNPLQNFGDKTKQNGSIFDSCDPFDCEPKFGFSRVTAHATKSEINENKFAFLKDSLSLFDFDNETDSWDETDSGFVSRSSSQDDVFGEKFDYEGKNSTWKFVSGEDSLWQPLPECVEAISNKMPVSYNKQVRNFRRPRTTI